MVKSAGTQMSFAHESQCLCFCPRSHVKTRLAGGSRTIFFSWMFARTLIGLFLSAALYVTLQCFLSMPQKSPLKRQLCTKSNTIHPDHLLHQCNKCKSAFPSSIVLTNWTFFTSQLKQKVMNEQITNMSGVNEVFCGLQDSSTPPPPPPPCR